LHSAKSRLAGCFMLHVVLVIEVKHRDEQHDLG
jgi:hypothetical protein